MPDISLCRNEFCPLRNNCYRATAVPSEYMQSYAVFELKEDGSCDYIIKIKSKENWKENTK